MPFIPHTQKDTEEMLATIGINSTEELFSEIPKHLLVPKRNDLKRMSEMEAARFMAAEAKKDEDRLCFIGAGAYEHHIPAPVWDIAARAEFMTAYTPYQAEASQGSLQLMYEYQTMMARLTGMDVSNASLYDGATSLAEAILMAVRLSKNAKSRRVLIPTTVHPFYRGTAHTTVHNQNIELVDVPFDSKTGKINLEALKKAGSEDFVALVIPLPNFFGQIEDIDALTDFAHECGAFVIAVINPTAIALFKDPGKWGKMDKKGADIVCGEAQPLGIPISAGGPYLGLLCCKSEYIRQMSGRIAGATTDMDGKVGYCLTLQAREQHIRRSKATSNICSNEGLLVVAAAIYMSLLGPEGIKQVASISHARTKMLLEKITKIPGVRARFSGTYFHEVVVDLPKDATKVIEQMAEYQIEAGLALSSFYQDMDKTFLICATETKTEKDIDFYCECLRKVLAK